MATKHWGEIPEKPTSDFFIPDVMVDIERSMNNFCLMEYQDDGDIKKTEQIVFPPVDPLIMYAICLHKYANDMTEMIRVAELATDANVVPSEDAAPPMPIMPEINIKHKKNSLNYMPKDFKPFTCDTEIDVPELNTILVKKILAKCVAIMFAHIGFETTHESVLDVLTDVLESFFQKFCQKLINAMEEEHVNQTSFPHVIERVLTETGMGGVKGLNDYYQNRVFKYVNVLQKRCKDLNDHYALLLIPNDPSPTDNYNKVVRLRKAKVEEDEGVMEIENPEVHFAAFDGETSVLETGYQLLSSLEAEENLHSMGNNLEEK